MDSRITTGTMEQLKARIRNEVDFSTSCTDEQFLTAVERLMAPQAQAQRWSSLERVYVANYLMAYFRGFDAIAPLIADDEVTEIMVNGPEHIFFERHGEIHRYDATFENHGRVEHLIQRIVAQVNRSINEAHPLVDARLPDGSRVHAVLQPIALNGPIMTIRKFPAHPWTMEHLIAKGALCADAAALCTQLVKSKYNIFVSGGTGSGKTTFLNVLAQSIGSHERVITIEDAAELQLLHLTNVVILETRPPNAEGKGELTMRQLLRAALRMRPDRIVVGEVRGNEALDMLLAMNTGLEGSLSTGHANSVLDMLRRLETMMCIGAELPLYAIQQQIASAIHIVIHLSRTADHRRKVTEICEVVRVEEGQYLANPLYVWQGDHTGGALVPTGHALVRQSKWEEGTDLR
jgi:pilus assembly protein CpaF